METELMETDFVGDEVLIAATAKIQSDVEVYYYNSYCDRREESHSYDEKATLEVIVEFTLNLPLEISTDIEDKEFNFDSFENFL